MSVVPKELLNKEFLSQFKTEEDVITVLRDRNCEFEPVVVPKHQSRGLSIKRLVLSLCQRDERFRHRDEMRDIYRINLSTSAI